MRGLFAAVAVLQACFAAAATPPQSMGQYMGQEPVRVTIEDLVRTGAMYNDRPVIVRGELNYGDVVDNENEIYELRGEMSLNVVRVGMAVNSFENLRFMAGSDVEVTGIFFDLTSVMMPERHPVLRYFPGAVRDNTFADKQYFIAVTSIVSVEPIESDLKDDPNDIPEIEDPDIDASGLPIVDLRELVANPEPYVGQQISVLGKFRGSNLYGDLSIRNKRTPRDFVIKVADSAIWVTGRRPRGEDFRLDPDKRRDTGEWLRVIGEPWEFDGVYYLRADKVELAEEPEDPDLEPVRVSHVDEDDPGPPPEVVFSLPLAGERIPLHSEFQVQFSKDMKPESFHRNVDLLYADDDGFGIPFPDLEVIYDDATRTMTVKPHKPLDPAKELRLILYDPIEDTDGQKLVVDPEAAEIDPAAATVLTFRTASS